MIYSESPTRIYSNIVTSTSFELLFNLSNCINSNLSSEACLILLKVFNKELKFIIMCRECYARG